MISVGNNNFVSLNELGEKFNVDKDVIISILDDKKIKYMYLGEIGYVLESEFIRLFKSQEIYSQASKRTYPITEKEILEATIKILHNKNRISIRELREYLKETMTLSDEDLMINKNRKDTRFDQKVRNLVSHREGNGLMEYCNYENGFLSLKED